MIDLKELSNKEKSIKKNLKKKYSLGKKSED